MILNGYKVEIDNTDAEFSEKYEDALEKLQKQENELQEQLKSLKGKNVRSKAIRMQCQSIFDFFDNVLGEGTHEKIFKGKVSLKLCIDTLEEFVANVIAQDKAYEEVIKKATAKYSIDRLKR